jgi:hypothetical protein
VSDEGPSQFYQVVTKINSELGPILSTRPYVAIIDFRGSFRFIEPELEQYKEFVQDFAKTNFRLLQIGDHSMPISGLNLAFFKISAKAIIVIYTKKGLIGQLLVFKARMLKYQPEIDALILEDPSLEEPDVHAPTITGTSTTEAAPSPEEPDKSKVIPLLLKKIGKKAKFPLNEVVILNYCNGTNTIEYIMSEGNLQRKAVWEILDKYKKKGWVKITYTGNPIFVPVLVKDIPPMAVQLGVVNKKEFEISKLCTGANTIDDIEQALGMPRDELDEIIDKMEKNSIIHLEVV